MCSYHCCCPFRCLCKTSETDGYQKTGHFNVLCPGFIQLTSDITLGLTLQPSTYNGPQNDMLINLHQVKKIAHSFYSYML